MAEWGLFEVATLAETKNEYLLRPELGRSLAPTARSEVSRRCPAGGDCQVAIADGLSAMAVRSQVPRLMPLLRLQAQNAVGGSASRSLSATGGWECSTTLVKLSIRQSSYS